MSDFALERSSIIGQGGAGSVSFYTTGPTQRFRFETIAFRLDTDGSAGTRVLQLAAFNASGNIVWLVPDWNDVPASATIFYTFGIGLEAFCGAAVSGVAIQNALPDTVAEPGTTIQVASLDTAGTIFTGDVFSAVVLTGIADTIGPTADVIPLLTPVVLGEQAGG